VVKIVSHGFKGPNIATAIALGAARPAVAGMPSVGFSEMAQLRLEAISFFLLGLLVSAAVIRWLWNWLVRELPGWPRLTYPKACAAVTLWGLLFVIVLTMISGARELMTPGAWKKKGATYVLRDSDEVAIQTAAAEETLRQDRLKRIERLATLLQAFAAAHDGRYPTSEQAASIPEDSWRLPDASNMQYVYVPGLTTADADAVIVYEPNIFRGDSFVLLANGKIEAVGEPGGKTAKAPLTTAGK
jgi:hypothetical protein